MDYFESITEMMITTSEYNGLKATIDALTAQNKQAAQEITNLTKKNQVLLSKLTRQIGQTDYLKQQIKNISKMSLRLNKEFAQREHTYKNQLKATIAAKQLLFSQLTSQLQSLKLQLANATNLLTISKEQRERAQEEKAQFKNQLTSAKQQTEKIKKQLQLAKEEKDTIGFEFERELNEAKQNLEDYRQQADQKIKKAVSHVEQQRSKYNRLRIELQELQQRQKQNRERLDELTRIGQDQKVKVQSKLRDKDKKIDQMLQENQQLKKNLNEFEKVMYESYQGKANISDSYSSIYKTQGKQPIKKFDKILEQLSSISSGKRYKEKISELQLKCQQLLEIETNLRQRLKIQMEEKQKLIDTNQSTIYSLKKQIEDLSYQSRLSKSSQSVISNQGSQIEPEERSKLLQSLKKKEGESVLLQSRFEQSNKQKMELRNKYNNLKLRFADMQKKNGELHKRNIGLADELIKFRKSLEQINGSKQ